MLTEQELEAVEDEKRFPHSGEFPPPKGGWLCFHCGERFLTWGSARDHFGATPAYDPGCLIKVKLGEERGLQMELRRVEEERDELQVRVAAMKIGLNKDSVADAVNRFRASRSATGQ